MKHRTACARCVHKQNMCRWPGQPEKPSRQRRKNQAPSSPSKTGQERAASPERTPSPGAHTERTARENVPEPSSSRLRADAQVADKGDDNVQIVEAPVATPKRDHDPDSFLHSGVSWSSCPEEEVSVHELMLTYLTELQEFRREFRICVWHRQVITSAARSIEPRVGILFAAVIAAQERSEAVLSYFGIDVGDAAEEIGTPDERGDIVMAADVV